MDKPKRKPTDKQLEALARGRAARKNGTGKARGANKKAPVAATRRGRPRKKKDDDVVVPAVVADVVVGKTGPEMLTDEGFKKELRASIEGLSGRLDDFNKLLSRAL